MCPGSLKTYRALVTGAGGRGIGRAVVQTLAAHGAVVAIHYRRSKAGAVQLADSLQKAGMQACLIQGDLATVDGPAKVVEQAKRQLGGVDILVNSAGGWVRKPLLETSAAAWDELMHSDARAAFLTTQALVPGMIERGWGRVVNVSSVAGFRYLDGEGAYGTAKAAINMLTRSFAVELAPYGVTVNAVAPALTVGTEAPMPPQAADYPECGDVPDLRPGHATEVAALIKFLCSQEAAHITGQIIAIDGGLTAKAVKAH